MKSERGNNGLYQSNGLHRNNIYINTYCNILHMLFKKIIIKIYNKWEKRGMLLQNIAYPTGNL